MEQSDFLNKLDNGGSYVPPQPPKSPNEINLSELIERKNKLSQEWDRCPICNGESRGACDGEHTTDKLQAIEKEINELELSMRG